MYSITNWELVLEKYYPSPNNHEAGLCDTIQLCFDFDYFETQKMLKDMKRIIKPRPLLNGYWRPIEDTKSRIKAVKK